jgi:outer membrane protein assembly factor BamB
MSIRRFFELLGEVIIMNLLIASLIASVACLPIADREETKSKTMASAAWPQFRGPGGQGITPSEGPSHVEFGPAKNLAWKAALPAGASSPCIWADRLFVTGFDKNKQKLETLCLDRQDGRILWRQTAPADKIEKVMAPNTPATPTPATDGERVYVYFGSFGLLSYSLDGKDLWKRPLPVQDTTFGTATSPVVAGDRVLLTTLGKDSALCAFDGRTGEVVWKNNHPKFRIGYSVPVYRPESKGSEILLQGARGVAAYDLANGKERWWVGGLSGGGIPTPVEGDGLLFVVSHFPGGDPDDRMKLPSFDELLAKYDTNKDGKLTLYKELPPKVILYDRGGHDPFSSITMDDMVPFGDEKKEAFLERPQWEKVVATMAKTESAMIAVRPEGQGDLTQQAVVWKEKRALPEVPSPLYYQGKLYLVKDGGIVSCYDAKTGKLHYRERLGAGGFYYSSPVAGDGKIYAASVKGVMSVFQAGEKFKLLGQTDLAESVLATPALLDGKLYVRTEEHLYAFGG